MYIAYDRPYTYSQNLKTWIDSIRNDEAIHNFCQIATLCKSAGGNDIQLMTITENVGLSLTYFEHLKMQQKKDVRDRYSILQDIEKMNPQERKDK